MSFPLPQDFMIRMQEMLGDEYDDFLQSYENTNYQALRVNRLKGTKAGQNPIMWCEGVLARLDPNEEIDKLFYDGYASISIGYIGIYETCQILGREGDKNLALGICQHMKDKCAEFKERSRLGFSLYGTPKHTWAFNQ